MLGTLIIIIFFGVFLGRSIYVISHWGKPHGWFDKYDYGNLLGAIGYGILYSFLVLFVSFIICFVGVDPTEIKSHSVVLYGLSNGSTSEGSLFLGSGSIDGEQYIFYNAKAENNLLKTYKVKNSSCYFDNNSPTTYLEVKDCYSPSRVPWLTEPPLYRKTIYIFHLRKEDMNIRNYYDISKYQHENTRN